VANHEGPMLIALLHHPDRHVDELYKNACQEQSFQVVVLFQ
jgi:hypothetical protein